MLQCPSVNPKVTLKLLSRLLWKKWYLTVSCDSPLCFYHSRCCHLPEAETGKIPQCGRDLSPLLTSLPSLNPNKLCLTYLAPQRFPSFGTIILLELQQLIIQRAWDSLCSPELPPRTVAVLDTLHSLRVMFTLSAVGLDLNWQVALNLDQPIGFDQRLTFRLIWTHQSASVQTNHRPEATI